METPASPTRSSDPGQLLLSPEFMRQLDRLDVLSRKILVGKLMGERRSKKRGQSVEFADYRNYVAGDDLRFIDWNLYARLDKLFLRLFMEEEDLSVTILFDVSRSMDYGSPNKLSYVKRLAAAMGYIGLTHYNRVGVFAVSDHIVDGLRGLRGRRPVPQLLDFLSRQQVQAQGDLAAACRAFSLQNPGRGVVLLISDFLDKGELTDTFGYLSGAEQDVYAIQVLSPEEVDPERAGIVGDLKLRDIEDADLTEVSAGGALLRQYRATVRAFQESIRQTCLRRGVAHLFTETSTPFETLVLQYFRQRGLIG